MTISETGPRDEAQGENGCNGQTTNAQEPPGGLDEELIRYRHHAAPGGNGEEQQRYDDIRSAHMRFQGLRFRIISRITSASPQIRLLTTPQTPRNMRA